MYLSNCNNNNILYIKFYRLGIRCNAVLPGLIDTTLIKDVPDKVKELFINMSAMKRIGKPEGIITIKIRFIKIKIYLNINKLKNIFNFSEVAEVVAFLASSKSSYVNGASIEVTGG